MFNQHNGTVAMDCAFPVRMYPPKQDAPSKRYVIDPRKAGGLPIDTSCGHCAPCRSARIDDWATRMIHEMKMSPPGSCHFVTYTFSDAGIATRGTMSLSVKEHQDHLKRIRKEYGEGVRFCLAAEYGSQGTHRAHYHYVFFNLQLDDLVPAEPSKAGLDQWTSAKLERIWGLGKVWVGTVTLDSCEYVASYILKRSSNAKNHLIIREHLDADTGELTIDECIPEFGLSSRRPGIGAAWFEKNKGDCYPSDFVVIDGMKRRVPAYYKRKCDDLEREEISFRAQERGQERQRLLVEREKAPKRLLRPNFIDAGQRELLERAMRAGHRPKATGAESERATEAMVILELAAEAFEPDDQEWRSEHRDIVKERRELNAKVLSLRLAQKRREL